MDSKEKQTDENDDGWSSCTWEGAELATLRRGLRLTFRERIQWLEMAQKMVEHLTAGKPFIRAGGKIERPSPLP